MNTPTKFADEPVRASLLAITLLIVIYSPIFRNITESSSNSQMFLNMVFIAISLYISRQRVPQYSRSLLGGLAILVAFIIAVLAISVTHESPATRTLSDSGRLVLLLGFIYAGQNLSDTRFEDLTSTSKLILHSCLISVPFSLLVFIEPLWPIADLYKGRLSSDELNFHFTRASGFSGYPTDYGCLLVFGILVLHNLYRIGAVSKARTIAYYAILGAGIALSAARGAIIQLAGVGIIYIIVGIFSKQPKRRKASVAALIIATVATGSAIQLSSNLNASERSELTYFGYLIDAAANPDDSIIHRFTELEYSANIVFGNYRIPEGEDRVEPFGLDVIESALGHYAIRYGALGVAIYLGMMLFFIINIDRNPKNPLGRAVFFWLISFIIFVAPFSDVMSRLKGLAIYGLLVGCSLRRN